MANLNVSPSLQLFVDQQTDIFQAIANFAVDNNEAGVFAVLTANGYSFNTHGEAAIIVKSIITGTTSKQRNELSQLSQVPYINNQTNGTGGLKGPVGGNTTQGIGDDLLCVVGGLFGYPIGCKTEDTPETEAQKVARIKAEEEAARKQRNMYIIIGVVVVIILIAVIYIFTRKKPN